VRDEGGPLLARFVCDWALPEAEIDRFVEIARG
jgi:threonine aldolase